MMNKRYTNEKFCNFILWSDRRTTDICNYYNNAFYLNSLTKMAKLLYSSLIPTHHFLAISTYEVVHRFAIAIVEPAFYC